MDWENYFNKFLGEQIKTELEHCDLFIFRDDGIPLYSNRKVVNRESLGALMAGSFQAVKALSSFIPNLLDQEFFRFSYDASDCGIYILPFNLKKKSFIFAIIFHSQDNPGLLKSKMRGILEKIKSSVDEIPMTKTKKEGFLFNDLSDKEIDKIFSFERNS